MIWTRGLLSRIELPHYCIAGTTRKGNLSYTTNKWREVHASTEMNLINVILRIDIWMEEGQYYVIKFFLPEGQELIEIYHSSCIHDQDDAMKKSIFCFWDAEIRAERADFSMIQFMNQLHESLCLLTCSFHFASPHSIDVSS